MTTRHEMIGKCRKQTQPKSTCFGFVPGILKALLKQSYFDFLLNLGLRLLATLVYMYIRIEVLCPINEIVYIQELCPFHDFRN